MILADTSIWVEHLSKTQPLMRTLLDENEILIHPFVVGEIALGNLASRALVLENFATLPPAPIASDLEVQNLIEVRRLYGSGIGYVDAHLVSAVLLANPARLWTRDRRLAIVADRLGIAFNPA